MLIVNGGLNFPVLVNTKTGKLSPTATLRSRDNENMKICHISTVHEINDTRIFHKECVSLSKKRYDVTLIAVGKSKYSYGIRCIGIKKYSRLNRFIFGISKVYHLALRIDADIYHLHDPELLLIVWWLKKKNKKIIFDSHEDYGKQIMLKYYIPIIFRYPIAFAYKYFQKMVSKFLDGFIFPASDYKLDVRCPVTIIGNEPILNNNLNLPSILTKSNSICYVGSLTEDRGITNLIKAAYKANVKLILAGKFQSRTYLEKLKSMLEYRCVDYRGLLDHSKIESILLESKIGIAVLKNVGQYADNKNLATKVYEYCQYGLPVILNKTKYNCEMIKKYQFGVCIENLEDIESFAQKIQEVLSNDDQLVAMSSNGIKMVLEEHNWDKEFSKLEKLYFSI